MADYTTITDAQVDPEAPITSELMSALRDNPIAIAEAAATAPKIDPRAMDNVLAGPSSASISVTPSTTTVFTVTDLDDAEVLYATGIIELAMAPNGQTQTGTLFYQLSKTNGSTWSETTPTGQTVVYDGTLVTLSSPSASGVILRDAGAITIPMAGFNAVRLRLTYTGGGNYTSVSNVVLTGGSY